jgi:hypothetical protein
MLGGISASTLILLQYSIPYIRLLGDGPSMTNYELRKKQTVSKYYCSVFIGSNKRTILIQHLSSVCH